MVRRWQQLPWDHALRASGQVRALAQTLADETCRQPAETRGQRTEPCVEPVESRHRAPRIPDLGPATALDQLRVTVYDAQRAGLDRDLPERLTRLLHDIG